MKITFEASRTQLEIPMTATFSAELRGSRREWRILSGLCGETSAKPTSSTTAGKRRFGLPGNASHSAAGTHFQAHQPPHQSSPPGNQSRSISSDTKPLHPSRPHAHPLEFSLTHAPSPKLSLSHPRPVPSTWNSPSPTHASPWAAPSPTAWALSPPSSRSGRWRVPH